MPNMVRIYLLFNYSIDSARVEVFDRKKKAVGRRYETNINKMVRCVWSYYVVSGDFRAVSLDMRGPKSGGRSCEIAKICVCLVCMHN